MKGCVKQTNKKTGMVGPRREGERIGRDHKRGTGT